MIQYSWSGEASAWDQVGSSLSLRVATVSPEERVVRTLETEAGALVGARVTGTRVCVWQKEAK